MVCEDEEPYMMSRMSRMTIYIYMSRMTMGQGPNAKAGASRGPPKLFSPVTSGVATDR